MKKVIIALTLVGSMLLQPAIASNNVLCEKIEELAGSVMKARQVGVSASSLLQNQVTGTLPSVRNIHSGMIILAFEFPIFPLEVERQQAIINFQRNWYLACLKEFK